LIFGKSDRRFTQKFDRKSSLYQGISATTLVFSKDLQALLNVDF